MKNFAIIGPTGYIGKRHLKAINEVGGNLICYLDINKSKDLSNNVEYFHDQEEFFKAFKRYKIDYCVICSPNHLHFSHILNSLISESNVICEKPITISKQQFQDIEEYAEKYNKTVSSIMQLRLHPVLNKIKEISNEKKENALAEIEVITPRNEDYLKSWKTDKEYSGGIIFNLGIHYFDLLISALGSPTKTDIIFIERLRAKGATYFNDFKVNWFFSIDPNDQNENSEPSRVFKINDKDLVFSSVPNDLHVENYKHILNSNDFDLYSIKPTMEYIFSINR
jgi:Predicted dehydrogenases and related proteins